MSAQSQPLIHLPIVLPLESSSESSCDLSSSHSSFSTVRIYHSVRNLLRLYRPTIPRNQWYIFLFIYLHLHLHLLPLLIKYLHQQFILTHQTQTVLLILSLLHQSYNLRYLIITTLLIISPPSSRIIFTNVNGLKLFSCTDTLAIICMSKTILTGKHFDAPTYFIMLLETFGKHLILLSLKFKLSSISSSN